jgi:hypothetical protein
MEVVIMKIFISYRREDSADISGRIYDRLADHFGDAAVFKDVDDIPLGVNFKTYLNDTVKQCAVELVVIGPQWLDVTDRSGRRRLDDPTDFVRIEVEAALRRDIPVIPLLVQGASMPGKDRLPSSLAEFSYRNGIPVRPDPDFHRDMNRLMRDLEKYVAPRAKPEKPAARPQPEPRAPVRPAPPSPPEEKVFYEQAGDRITNYVAQVSGTTYAMSDISSVSMEKLKPTTRDIMRAATPGFILSLAFGLSICFGMAYSDDPEVSSIIGIVNVLVFAGLFIAILYASWQQRPKYAVRIRDSSGERDILVSKNKSHIQKVVNAIKKALAQKR